MAISRAFLPLPPAPNCRKSSGSSAFRSAGVFARLTSTGNGSIIRENVKWIDTKNTTQVKVHNILHCVGGSVQWIHRAKGAVAMGTYPQIHVLATSTVQSPVEIFPAFLPPEVQLLQEPAARQMASKLQQLPVQTSLSQQPILTSCVCPSVQGALKLPLLLLHGFDSSSLEWRRLYPLLEAGGAESWAVDVLGWGFSNTEGVSSFGVLAKREHLYEFWKAHIKKPVVLVGASLGGSIAIDFAMAHPDAVSKLVLIDAQGFTEGVGNMSTFPKFLAYAGIALLKSVPLRSYANYLAFRKITTAALFEAMRVGRLHTLVAGWADASVSFMLSGGYNVATYVPKVKQETLVIWGKEDKILPREYAERFQTELPRARLEYVKDCGHVPHVETPNIVAELILQFITPSL